MRARFLFTLFLMLSIPCAHIMNGVEMSDAEMEAMDDMEMDEALVEPNGSGTAWLPQSAPVHEHARHFSAGDWNLMVHGQAMLRYTVQNVNNSGKPKSDPGVIDGPNWVMLEGTRTLWGEDQLVLRTMASLDILTETNRGYPLLFQTGEGLFDRQHPHDLFMEISALYVHHWNENNQSFVYLALPGEPALGPNTFMHRPSDMSDPDAPLAHHMQDATHITYGVATLGWIYKTFKLDASTFRGREPDGYRWDVEMPRFDSYSLRLTYNLDPNLSAQVSGGFAKDVEPDEPNTDIAKGTASLEYNLPFGAEGNWSSALIYGTNRYLDGDHKGDATESYAVESRWAPGSGSLWLRWESLERIGAELDLGPLKNSFLWIHALSLGAGKTLFTRMGMELELNAKGTVNFIPEKLESDYGRLPLGAQVFFVLRPEKMRM